MNNKNDEDYYFEISEEGSKGLDVLDSLFNRSTQKFLLNAGLQPDMKILEVGCGIGTMAAWLANQVGRNGLVVAIDNNKYQVQATANLAQANNLANIDARCISAYDLDELEDNFDLVYSRFILHHLIRPTDVIRSIYNILETDGTYVSEEGIVTQAFSFPFSSAWGNERWHNEPKDHETEGKISDRNFGIKLYNTMFQTGFTDLSVNLVHPVMTNKTEKSLLLKGLPESKKAFIQAGHTEKDWNKYCDEMTAMINNDAAMIAFYQSCQVSGRVNPRSE